MPQKQEVATDLRQQADELAKLALLWGHGRGAEVARAAADEAQAILLDAADELMRPRSPEGMAL